MNSAVIKRPESVDTVRLRRFMFGETTEDIALDEGVSLETVERSIERANRREQMVRQFQFVELRQKGQIENEKFRRRVRSECFDAAMAAIQYLLAGKRDRLTVDEATGAVTIQEVYDPEVVAIGVSEFRKLASLEEKPAVAPIIQIQNNAIINNPRGTFDFETWLTEIRRKQRLVHPNVFTDLPQE